MYFLERKEAHALPNILGNHQFPVHTYRWKAVAICETEEPLLALIPPGREKEYRVTTNNPEEQKTTEKE